MAGPRYEDWHHLRVEGDRDAARALVPLARKVLGFVVGEARRNGLLTYKYVHRLPNGGQIVGEVNGGIPRVSISVPQVGDKPDRRTLEGFVLAWGGTNEGWDSVILLPPPAPLGEPGWKDWRASFFSAATIGRNETPEDRRAGSYIDVFGIKAKAPSDSRLLPGNGLWVHRDTGEAVAWFRGYTGYWPEHYRHPRTNYGNWVTIYGHVVLLLGSGWRVMSAAMRDGWLYVMVGENLGVMNPPAVPPAPSYSGQVWNSQPYSNDEFTYSLWRLPLVVETQPDTMVESYTVNAAGAEMLWRAALRRAYGAWSFNADCSEVVTVQLPRIATYSWIYEIEGDSWVPSPVESATYPTVEANRLAISINHEADPPVASFSATAAPSLIAEEDGVQLEIVEHTRPFPDGSYGRNDYRIGDFTIPVTEQVVAGGVHWYERRVMLYAHLPSRTLLLHRWRTTISPERSVSAGFQLFVDGEEVEIDDPSAIETGIGSGLWDIASASNHFRMMGIGYDDGVGTSWYRPMDAMSFLLGFGFNVQGAVPVSVGPAEPSYGYQSCPHYGFTFSPLNNSEHSAAGGYVFGSSGGDGSGHFWGWSFTLAKPYGANFGSYTDTAPSEFAMTNYIGAGATNEGNTLVAAGLQPMLGIDAGGVSPLSTLANQNRYIHLGTNGDAATLLGAITGAAGGAPWRRFTLSHTGKPRPGQRGIIHGR